VAIATGNIGNVHYLTGDYPAALSHLHRALALHEELGARRGVAFVTGNIGNVLGNTGDYPAALSHLHRALALHEELGDRRGVAGVTGNILSAYVMMGSVAEAQQLLQTMDGLHIDEPRIRIQRELQRATLQERSGDLDVAAVTLQRARSEAIEHGLRSEVAETHKALRALALKQNNLAAYVEHNNEFTRITEEINGRDTATKLAMQAKQREIDAERKETEKHMAVLHSTLPKHIADRVARGEVVNDHYDNAAVIFLDIVGFTAISDRIPSGHVVHLLEQIFTTLDAVCEEHNVVKIKTIGDSYMAVAFGVASSEQRVASAAPEFRAAMCALDMLGALDALEVAMPPALGDTSWTKDIGEIKVRIGVHCGPLTAGVLGTQRMQYDVWGDTVNVASRLESTSEPGRIHVSQAFAEALITSPPSPLSSVRRGSDTTPLILERGGAEGAGVRSARGAEGAGVRYRGEVDLKGKGMMQTYWLE
jgi:class 3 adenylate cyclase